MKTDFLMLHGASNDPSLALLCACSLCPGPPHQCCFFQFADGVRVASIPRQIQTDFVKLATLFQGALKTAARRHKCGDTLTQKKKLLSLLGDLKSKTPLLLVARVFLK